MTEFELIRHYFQQYAVHRDDVPLGIGDDCALLQPMPGHQLAVTTDTMVEGIHFDARLSAQDIGHKLLAVNLSDLAAMGAIPCWISLALTLPHADKTWLAGFAQGLAESASEYGVALIGGDTTRGPLTLTVSAQGQLPVGSAMCRSGGQVGDLIFVSGHLGDAALALNPTLLGKLTPRQCQRVESRLFRPTPRVALGQLIRPLATACIDLSDGLAVDLAHILRGSGVGARLDTEQLPVSEEAKALLGEQGALQNALNGGDDYELCFCAPAQHQDAILAAAQQAETQVHCIGQLEAGGECALFYEGTPVHWSAQGYLHFR